MAEGFTGPGTDTSPASTYKASGARGFVYDGSTPPNNGDLPTFDSTAGAYKPAAPSGGGAGGVLVSDPIVVTSADLLGLNNGTTFALLATPGSAAFHALVGLAFAFVPGETPYVYSAPGSTSLAVLYGSDPATAVATLYSLANAGGIFDSMTPLQFVVPISPTFGGDLRDLPLSLWLSDPITDGDGFFVVWMFYRPLTPPTTA